MTVNYTILSGSPDALGSAIEGLGPVASKTTIHTFPSDKVHTVWVTICNTDPSTSAIVEGDVGASAATLYWDIPAQGQVTIGPLSLKNTTLKLGSDDAGVAAINVTGVVMEEE